MSWIPCSPNSSFAHLPLLSFKLYTKLLRSGEHVLNLTLFLSYHIDQITYPSINLQSFFFLLDLIRPPHAIMKSVQQFCKTPCNLYRFKIVIHTPQESLQVKRICEFDYISKLQNGHRACWVSTIPHATRRSPIFNFSKLARQRVIWALGGAILPNWLYNRCGYNRRGRSKNLFNMVLCGVQTETRFLPCNTINPISPWGNMSNTVLQSHNLFDLPIEEYSAPSQVPRPCILIPFTHLIDKAVLLER